MRNFPRLAVALMLAAWLSPALAALQPAQPPAASLAPVVDALRGGRNEEALRLSEELLRSQPLSEKAWALHAVALERTNQPKEALASYQHALTLAPDYLPALEGAAQLQYRARSAQAMPLLRHIVALQPANPTAHAMLGTLEYRQGQYAAAADDFAAAGEAVGSQPAALMDDALCLARLNRLPEAMARLQQLLALRPEDVAARDDLAMLQWRSNAPGDALATLQPLLDAHTADSRSLRLAAAIHEANNETPQAVELLRAAIAANPDDPDTYVDFATLSFAHGSYSVGVDIVNLGLARLPNSGALYMARGVLYGQNGDFEKAMADFEQAHRLDPNSSMAATAEGIAQSQRHNSQAALADFRRQVREHPRDALACYLLAEALSASPSDAKQNGAATSIAEAISMARRAIALDAQMVEAYDLLASLQIQNGQLEDAAKTARAALALQPRDQQAVYSLILALRKTGSKEELKGLVQTLTELRKTDNAENERKARYGQLVEEP